MKITTLICFFSVIVAYGQQSMSLKSSKINPKNGYSRCSTTEYEDYLLKKNPKRLSAVQFENWIAPIIAIEREKRKNNKTQQKAIQKIVTKFVSKNFGSKLGKKKFRKKCLFFSYQKNPPYLLNDPHINECLLK